MIRSKYFGPCVFAVLGIAANAQTITLLDAETSEPIEAASIGVRGGISLPSDVNGRASIDAFRGADSILIAHPSYAPRSFNYSALQTAPVVKMEPLGLPLQEFVLSANRWEQDRSRVPDKITAMKARDVAFNNPGTTADLLTQSGEVYVQKTQLAGGSPMLRGFAANRVLIVVDGVRMNNAIYRAGNLQNVINVDVNAVERAEVVHGPGAMTYGSDAIGGVMDFQLVRPRFDPDSSLLIHGGALVRYATAAQERTGHLHLGLGTRKLAFVGSASFTRFGDLRMGTNGPDDYLRPWYAAVVNGVDSQVVNEDRLEQTGTAFDNKCFMGKLAFRPSDRLEVGLSAYYSTTSDAPRYDALITERPDGAPRWAQWTYGPQDWRMATIRLQHRALKGPWSEARITVAGQRYRESRLQRGFGSTASLLQEEEVSGVWANADMNKQLGRQVQLLYGLETVHNTIGSTGAVSSISSGSSEIINPRYPNGSTWWTTSAYGGVMIDLRENLTLSAGARYNRSGLRAAFDTTLFPYPVTSTTLDNGALTGNLGTAWRPAGSWKIAVDLSTGFRSPNIDDIGKVFSNEPGSVIVPNGDLTAEYAYCGELTVEKRFGRRVRANATLYHIIVDDVMVRRPYTLNGEDSITYEGQLSRVDAIQNAAQAKVTGATFALDASLGSGFSAELRATLQTGFEEDEAGDKVPLRHSPPSFGRVGLGWSRNKLEIRALFTVSDGFTTDELAPTEKDKPIYALDATGRPYSPSWQVLDVKGGYRLLRSVLLTAGVENVLDARYRTYSSGIAAPGRNFIVGLRATF